MRKVYLAGLSLVLVGLMSGCSIDDLVDEASGSDEITQVIIFQHYPENACDMLEERYSGDSDYDVEYHDGYKDCDDFGMKESYSSSHEDDSCVEEDLGYSDEGTCVVEVTYDYDDYDDYDAPARMSNLLDNAR